MSKYIDSEKLIAEIERRLKDYWEISFHNVKAYGKDSNVRELKELHSFITSLQQEQPSPRWIHANYSSKPEIRYTPSGTPYLQNGSYMIWLSDLKTLPKDGTDLTNPGPEQPEVDLDEEITRFWKKEKESGQYIDTSFDTFVTLQHIAYHFANWQKEQDDKVKI